MYSDFNYTTEFGKKKRNKDNTGPDMKDLEAAPPTEKPPKVQEPNPQTHAASSNTDASKEKNWLQKLDGQGNGGKGGRLSNASDVFAKLAKNTPGSAHQGIDYNRNIASTPGESKNPYTVTDEGYSGGMKSSEGPQTTLLRDIETKPKKKKKNKNYEDY